MRLPRGAVRVRAAFAAAAHEERAALIAYLVAGHPDDDASLAAADAALEAGADVLEIGVPFSDPVADGPIIAAAGHATVAAGGGFASAVRLISAIRARGHTEPLLAMGYLNPLVARGMGRSLGQLAEAGADGVILPDLPAGEDHQVERLIADAGLGAVFLVTPNTSAGRLEAAIRASTAFLYVVPLFGVTGAGAGLAESTGILLDRVRGAAAGRIPVAVGFGIKRPEQARDLATHADGVVVGTAIVSALSDSGPAGVGRLVASLAGAVSAGR
jgi:tryptophan synthase alpha chain